MKQLTLLIAALLLSLSNLTLSAKSTTKPSSFEVHGSCSNKNYSEIEMSSFSSVVDGIIDINEIKTSNIISVHSGSYMVGYICLADDEKNFRVGEIRVKVSGFYKVCCYNSSFKILHIPVSAKESR